MVETNLIFGNFGKYNFPIREIKFNNLTILSGRTGSGKTYLVSKLLQEIKGSKLLLSSEGGCKYDYLTSEIDKRIPYYDVWWNDKKSNILDSLILNLTNNYETVIVDDILHFSSEQNRKLIRECLEYRDTNFFLIGLLPITGDQIEL